MSDNKASFRLSLWRDRRGSITLEFAILLPVICLIVTGFYEAYSYIRAVSLVERTAASLANIMSRQTSNLIDCRTADSALNLGTYMAAAERVSQPLSLAKNGQVFLSAVDNPSGSARVAWQRRGTFDFIDVGSVLGLQGTTAKVPTGLTPDMGNNDTLIVAEVAYRFRPFAYTAGVWPGNPGVVTIQRAAYFRARVSAQNTLLAPTNGCLTLPVPN
ncbi:MAG TPA: hypothetical protein VK196_03885 [Magnetospirillum sp.]|nr:hypothetical protein [Magnetospirillum sp.]